jgi:uncharacterized protein YndB with AHSA1/START domain
METRREELIEPFGVTPERMFEILITPSAIRSWYGAAKVVVDPKKGGSWIAAWGDDEDDSEYINALKILEFDPPNRIVLGEGKYIAGTAWPIMTDIRTELILEPQPSGCFLRIVQDLTPHEPLLDDYFDACIAGWQNSYEGIRNYIHNNPSD